MLALAPNSVMAQVPASPASTQYEWIASVAPRATITIENPHGTITLRRAVDGKVSFRATASAPLWRDVDAVDVRALAHGNDVEICTVVPDVAAPCEDGAIDSAALRRAASLSEYRVDEVVDVPTGVRVVARGLGDVVVADGLAGVTVASLDAPLPMP
jgi:hypothetical protein